MNGPPPPAVFFSDASIVQYSVGVNALISASRSQMSLTATDCTRPALSPRPTFFQRRGLRV